MLSILAVANVVVPLVFSGIKRRNSLIIISPQIVMLTLQIILLIKGDLFISEYYSSIWGNIGILEVGQNPFKFILGGLAGVYSCISTLVILIIAWRRHPAHRYRSFVLKYLLITGAAMFCGLFGYFTWLGGQYPNTTFSFGIVYSLGMFALMRKYSFLSNSHPMVDKILLRNLQTATLVVDNQGYILSANYLAEKLMGKNPGTLEHTYAVESVPSLGDLKTILESMTELLLVRHGKIGEKPVSLTINPSMDQFGRVETAYIFLNSSETTSNLYGLTTREEEITELIALGLTSSKIAEKLFISTGTVKNHLKSIFRKTGVGNRTQLAHTLFQQKNSPQ